MPAIHRRSYPIHPTSLREVWTVYTPDAIFAALRAKARGTRLSAEDYTAFKEAIKASLRAVEARPEGQVSIESAPWTYRVPSRICVTNRPPVYRERLQFAIDWRIEPDGVKTVRWSLGVITAPRRPGAVD